MLKKGEAPIAIIQPVQIQLVKEVMLIRKNNLFEMGLQYEETQTEWDRVPGLIQEIVLNIVKYMLIT
jgi:hypothetical protein